MLLTEQVATQQYFLQPFYLCYRSIQRRPVLVAVDPDHEQMLFPHRRVTIRRSNNPEPAVRGPAQERQDAEAEERSDAEKATKALCLGVCYGHVPTRGLWSRQAYFPEA